MRFPRFCALLFAAVCLVGLGARPWAAAAQEQRVNRVAALFKEFGDRVQEYVKFQKQHDSTLPALQKKEDPAEIKAHEKALAAAIKAARSTAKPGDIFFPEIQPEIVKILRTELKGPGSSTSRAAIKESKPSQVALRVNAIYPDAAPLSTVPPMVLLKLPPLPDQLEYRFVNHHLVLRDRKANLIVDFMPLPGIQI